MTVLPSWPRIPSGSGMLKMNTEPTSTAMTRRREREVGGDRAQRAPAERRARRAPSGGRRPSARSARFRARCRCPPRPSRRRPTRGRAPARRSRRRRSSSPRRTRAFSRSMIRHLLLGQEVRVILVDPRPSAATAPRDLGVVARQHDRALRRPGGAAPRSSPAPRRGPCPSRRSGRASRRRARAGRGRRAARSRGAAAARSCPRLRAAPWPRARSSGICSPCSR